MQAAQVEEEFLLLVPERAEGDPDRRLTVGQLRVQLLQAAAVKICFHTDMGDQIEAVPAMRRDDCVERPRTLAARADGLTHGLACPKRAMTQADHRPARRFLHTTAGPVRGRQAAEVWVLSRGIEVEAHVGRQVGGLRQAFRGLLLHLTQQGQQAQLRRFFSSA
jgi:hypothetical protein